MDFVEDIKKQSEYSARCAKASAVQYFVRHTGRTEADAIFFFERIAETFGDAEIVLDVPAAFALNLVSGHHSTPSNTSPLLPGLVYTQALCTRDMSARKAGNCLVVLRKDVEFGVLPGPFSRYVEPAHLAYERNPRGAVVSSDQMSEARAATAMMCMKISDCMGSAEACISALMAHPKDYGECMGLVFSSIKVTDVSMIVASSEDMATSLRMTGMNQSGVLVPIIVSEAGMGVVVGPDGKPAKSPERVMQMFSSGDRVTFKPNSRGDAGIGTVIESGPEGVLVEWASNRVYYDLVEALAVLMPLPDQTSKQAGPSSVVYSLPGMDESSVSVLSSFGLDPVNIYAVASTYAPAHAKSVGWEQNMCSALGRFGLRARTVNGWKETANDEKLAFSPSIWVEADIEGDVRLIIDVFPRLTIKAGQLDEYVAPAPESKYILE